MALRKEFSTVEQIRGVILEGQSCSGKTSMFNALKKLHVAQPDAERNVIFLSEHYSQNLNFANGSLRQLTRAENLKALSDRIQMLEGLSQYADAMGVHSRRSRGLFFVFERFHLNFAFCFPEGIDAEYRRLENRLCRLNAHTVLCTVSPDRIASRLTHRAFLTGEAVTPGAVREYIRNQERFLAAASRSMVPTTILNTDSMDWAHFAQRLLESPEA